MDQRSGIKAWKQFGAGRFSRECCWVPSVCPWHPPRLMIEFQTSENWQEPNAESNCSSLRMIILVRYLPGARDQIDTCGNTASSRTWMSWDDLNSWACLEWLPHLGPWYHWWSSSGATTPPPALASLTEPIRSDPEFACNRAHNVLTAWRKQDDASFLRLCYIKRHYHKNQMANPILRTHKSVIPIRVPSTSPCRDSMRSRVPPLSA